MDEQQEPINLVAGEDIGTGTLPELCPTCGHDFDQHLVVAEFLDPTKGGTISCPVEDCACYLTWSVAGEQAIKRIEDNMDIWEEVEFDSSQMPKDEML